MTSNYNRSSFLQNNNCQRLKLVRPRIFYGSNLYSCSCTVRLSDGVLFPSLVLHFHVPPLDYNLNTTLTLTVLQHMLGQKYFFLDPKDLSMYFKHGEIKIMTLHSYQSEIKYWITWCNYFYSWFYNCTKWVLSPKLMLYNMVKYKFLYCTTWWNKLILYCTTWWNTKFFITQHGEITKSN